MLAFPTMLHRTLRIAIGLLAAICCSPDASAQSSESQVSVSLVTDRDAAVPGDRLTLGVRFEIRDGWWLYWRNPGDSGGPISLDIKVPDGVTVGETLWPVPERHILPGGVLDYTYGGRVALLVPLEIDAALRANVGQPLEITVNASWLMCDDQICLPGSESVTTSIPIRPTAERGDGASLIERTHDRVPVLAPEGAVETSWEGLTLTIRVPGAESLTFLPFSSEKALARDLIESGAAKRDHLTINYGPTTREAETISGVLRVTGEGRERLWEFTAPGPGRAGASRSIDPAASPAS